MADAVRRVVLAAYDDAPILDIVCPSGALDAANRFGAAPPYALGLATASGRGVLSSAVIGIGIGGGQRLAEVPARPDTLMVVGGIGHERAAVDGESVKQVRRPVTGARRVSPVTSAGAAACPTGPARAGARR
ncbi:hypothetical protein [Streptomyces sp. B22F1]|uniref:hypothetical protein n=1 Tax=Streptomyces sp. B22F1 TaxID=3153566 RepID=UPI00119C6CEA